MELAELQQTELDTAAAELAPDDGVALAGLALDTAAEQAADNSDALVVLVLARKYRSVLELI